MDPDKFQMKDLKRRMTSVEKKFENYKESMTRRFKAYRLEVRALRLEVAQISAHTPTEEE